MADANVRAARAKQGSPFLTTAQAAFYVNLSRRTLEKMRFRSRGPRYRKHVRYVRYHIDDLDRWSVGNTGRSASTPKPSRLSERKVGKTRKAPKSRQVFKTHKARR
jgi:hypothetical protein